MKYSVSKRFRDHLGWEAVMASARLADWISPLLHYCSWTWLLAMWCAARVHLIIQAHTHRHLILVSAASPLFRIQTCLSSLLVIGWINSGGRGCWHRFLCVWSAFGNITNKSIRYQVVTSFICRVDSKSLGIHMITSSRPRVLQVFGSAAKLVVSPRLGQSCPGFCVSILHAALYSSPRIQDT